MLRKWKEKYVHKKLMQRHLELLNFSNFLHEFRYYPFTETEFEQFLIHFDFIQKQYPSEKEHEDQRIEELINTYIEMMQLPNPLNPADIEKWNSIHEKATQQGKYLEGKLQKPSQRLDFDTFLHYVHPAYLKLQYRQLCLIIGSNKSLQHSPIERTIIHYMIQHILKGIENQTLLKEESLNEN